MIISMGWITQVASIPEVPPLTKGFTVGHTPMDLAFFSSPILGFERMSGLGAQKGERESKGRKVVFFFQRVWERKRRQYIAI